MAEDIDKHVSSPIDGAGDSQTPKLKRKKAAQQSPDSPLNQSASPTAGKSRPKRAARRASRAPHQGRLAAKSPVGDAANSNNSPVPKTHGAAVPRTPSPKMTKAQSITSPPPQSPIRVLANALTRPASATPEPPASDLFSRLAARETSRPATQPSPDTINSRLFAKSITSLASDTFGPSAHSLNSMKKTTRAPNPSTLTAGRQPLFPLNPSPLASAPSRTCNSTPIMFHPAPALRYQQSKPNFHQDSQLPQQIPIATAHRVPTQKSNENDPNRDFFVYKGIIYTLKECVLACSLRFFCRHSGGNATEKLNDDTIAEILHYQRDWRHAEGLDCQDLVTILFHEHSNTRALIEDSIRVDLRGWEAYALTSYRDWMKAMRIVCASLTSQQNARNEAARVFQMNALSTFNPAHHQRLQEHVTGDWTQQIGSSDYPSEPLPRIQVTAANMDDLEEFSDRRVASERHKRLNEWVASEMLTNKFNFEFASEEHQVIQPRESINDGYLPQMEPSVDSRAFNFE